MELSIGAMVGGAICAAAGLFLGYRNGRRAGIEEGVWQTERRERNLYHAALGIRMGGPIVIFHRAFIGELTEEEMVRRLQHRQDKERSRQRAFHERNSNGRNA